MIKYNEIKVGDFVMADYDGQMWEGEVVDLNGNEKQVCVRTEVQEFWFDTQHLHPIPLDEAQLFKLGFQKETRDDNSAKYMKGAFRIVIKNNDFSHIQIWYREDHRFIDRLLMVHELQNNYLDMTKVHLTT